MSEFRPVLIDIPDLMVGERIVVRAWHDSDADQFFKLVSGSREHLSRWFAWPERYQSDEDARDFLRRHAALWLTRDDLCAGIFGFEGSLLGSVALHPTNWQVPSFEVGYWIGAQYEGKGYVVEAVRMITQLAFDMLGANRVVIQCDADNIRSANVARRCGYTYEGTFRLDSVKPDGRLSDTMVFSIIPSDQESGTDTPAPGS